MKEKEIKISESQLRECIEELRGSKFLSAYCIVDWLEKTMKEKKEMEESLKECEKFKDQLLIYNASMMYGEKKFIKYLENEINKKRNWFNKELSIFDRPLYESEYNFTVITLKEILRVFKEIKEKYVEEVKYDK